MGSNSRVLSCSVAVALATLASGCSFDSPLVATCEKYVIDRLKAPSTYVRISASENVKQLTIKEYLRKRLEIPSVQKLIKDTYTTAYEYTAFISYDAANSYGAPIRNTAMCTFLTLDKEAKPTEYSIEVAF